MGQSLQRDLGALASRQAGVVSRRQMRALGFSKSQIDRRLASGLLRPVHRGVYRVGHSAPAMRWAEWAAVLAGGQGGTIGGASACHAWAVLDRPPDVVQLLVPPHRRVELSGVRARRTNIHPKHLRRRNGLPLTSPALSLLDAAADLPGDLLQLALATARSRYLVRLSHFAELRAWQPARRGWHALGALLDAEESSDFERSRAEVIALGVLESAGFDGARRNFRKHGYELDIWIPKYRLAVEIDGYRFHSGRSSFLSDRRRDAALRSRGIEVWRLTWEQLTTRRAATVKELSGWRRRQDAPFRRLDSV